MGIFDKAKDLIGEHNEQVDQGVDKGADLLDERTGGTHGHQIDQGADFVKDRLDDYGGAAPEPAAEERPAAPPAS